MTDADTGGGAQAAPPLQKANKLFEIDRDFF
jgi:hypothetical protein